MIKSRVCKHFEEKEADPRGQHCSKITGFLFFDRVIRLVYRRKTLNTVHLESAKILTASHKILGQDGAMGVGGEHI